MIDSNKLSDLVCNVEKSFNKSRKQIAEEIGISRDMLYKLMGTDRNPSAENLQKIANYFHVSTDYLLKNEEEDQNEPTFNQHFGNNNTVITGHHNTTEVSSTQQSGFPNPPASSPTTPEEAEIIRLYRELTEEKKKALLIFLGKG